MNPEIPGIPEAVSDKAVGLWSQVQAIVQDLLLPWRFYQLAIILGIVLVAWLLRAMIAPKVHDWMRGLEGLEKRRLRVLVLLHRRIWLIATVLIAWTVLFIMQEVTWPSRSYLVGLFATITTAWLLVGLIGRLIRNPFLRRFVTWAAWVYVTLYYLDLDESVARILDGLALEFGEFRLTALAILQAIVITALLFTGARVISSLTAHRIQDNEDISPSMRVLAVKILQIVLYGAAFFIGLKSVGFDLTGLAVLSGAIGVGLGFGLQKVVSNLVSGVIILLDKSIKPGDVISLGETFGWINALTARYVSITTRDGKEFLIPNEDLITTQVVNWSHSNDYVRLDIRFGAAYDDDPHDVRKLAIAAAKSVDRVLSIRPPVCHIVGFGDSSVDYILRFWIRDPTEGLTNVRGGVFLALWDTFKQNGVSIPYPQREVRILGDTPAKPQVVLD